MLTNLHVQRFRGINELCLKDTSRVNLIVGRNDAGKTTVLEAIRMLLTGNPNHLKRRTRNLNSRRSVSTEQSIKMVFYKSLSDEPLMIEALLNDNTFQMSVEMAKILQYQPDIFATSEEDEIAENEDALLAPGNEVVVKLTIDGNLSATIRQELSDRGSIVRPKRTIRGDDSIKIPNHIWLGTNRIEYWDHARHYSSLYRSGGSDALILILREIEPRLKQLVVLTEKSENQYSSAVLEVDIGLIETLPLESMGDGFGNVIAMLSAIGSAKNGLCLIDELENGIHYSIQEKVWSSLALGAEKFDTQVWATTHSYDCLSSIHRAFEDRPEDLRVHRLERKDDGLIAVHTFNYEMLAHALESGLEVR